MYEKMSDAQRATFKTWLTNNAAGLSDDAAAALANTAVAPAYAAWRTTVSRDEVQGATAFDWTRVDNLSVGKARIWDYMFNKIDAIHPYRANIRTGIEAVWVGTQADLDVRAAVKVACQRPVTNFEKLFVVVTVGGPSQSGARGATTNPDTFGAATDGTFLEGSINFNDVAQAKG